MVSSIISARFILEVVTILGLVGGLFTKKVWGVKFIFSVLGIVIAVIWSRYGAPKSPDVLTGLPRLGLGLSVFGSGAVGAFVLYGKNIAWFYTAIVVIDLIGLYALGLN
ncbi:DUF2568 domain-containing protein [Streptococcus pantholopis]|uniref:DUF2568 domain-containing protein n=1 Tax=Streptococcus pantholopis TaxID=1811193 RepID=A0A172Q9E2_9STRE|nr:DUF2568 domain-containing protein [Streptococcus pantholopis]AND80123.1 hypothetical protein A0O21_08980 [Streptococcus pantholopis]